MLVHYLKIESISYSLKIHLIFHMSFLETQRMSLFDFHIPLYLIHLIMRMSMNSLIFLVVAVVIHLFPYLIKIMNLSQLIFLSLWFMMIYLMMKLKHPRLLRHFSLSWWLCQALTLFGLVSLLIMKLFNHPRLLVTHLYTLKIYLTHRSHLLHSNCTIPSLMHCRNITLQAHVYDASYLWFFRLLSCLIQECAYASKLHAVSHNTMIGPRSARHAIALTYVLWALSDTKCGCLHCYIFIAYWFA